MPFRLFGWRYGAAKRRNNARQTTKNATQKDEITPRETTKRRNNAWPKDGITKSATRKDEKRA